MKMSIYLGHGKLVMNDGSFYEGEFDEGEISGSGVRKWTTTGNVYEGEFFRGELTGKGTMKYGNGAVYEGEWDANMRQGLCLHFDQREVAVVSI